MNNVKLNLILEKYNLSFEEKRELLNIIFPIFNHSEFQRRMTLDFLHHSDITLGEHIIEVATMTYILTKKYELKNRKVNLDLALKIAMLHDLYTLPWQNNKKSKVKKFFNKHGFRHPIEATINAINWYPEIFASEEDKKVIIDGIIHHMYPLPVAVFKSYLINNNELKNFNLLTYLSNNDKKIIEESTKREKIFNISISKSLYLEGKVVSRADKMVSCNQIKNLSSAFALITGKNKSLK